MRRSSDIPRDEIFEAEDVLCGLWTRAYIKGFNEHISTEWCEIHLRGAGQGEAPRSVLALRCQFELRGAPGVD